MQRLGSREILEMHVVYDRKRLMHVHEAAGLRTLASGYAGFFDGYLSAVNALPRTVRFRLHAGLCRTFSLVAEAWLRAGRGAFAPELSWFAPDVYYVGAPAESVAAPPRA